MTPLLDDEVGLGFKISVEEELTGTFTNDEELSSGFPCAEERAGSSARGPTGVKMSLSDEHPKKKHTTPTHPRNVVIFFMSVNIVYIWGLNEKKEIYYVLTHYVER